jgi:hypothetical protein
MTWDVSQWGAFGSAIGGVGTVVAMMATVGLLWHEIRVRRREESERRRERLSEHARQARLIYGTAEPAPAAQWTEFPGVESNDMFPEGESVAVKVANFSDAPIWDVEIRVPGLDYPLRMAHVDPMSAESTTVTAPARWSIMNVSCGGPSTVTSTTAHIVFTDNVGIRWQRAGRSQPRKLELPELSEDDENRR